MLAPLGPVYQAGTLSGNPLAMAAGVATIGYLIEHEGEVYAQLERVTREIAEGVGELAREAGVAMTTNRVGSMFTWFFTGQAGDGFCVGGEQRHGGLRAFPQADAGGWSVAAAEPV